MAQKTQPISSNLYPLLFFLLLSHSTSQLPSNDQEQQILLQIKQEFNNPAALSSWTATSQVPHCNWTYVQCNELGSVTNLSPLNASLSSKFPASICNLKSLSYLELSGNYLQGSFPTSLYNCSSLTYLDLSQNLFIGEIPLDIDRMSSKLTDLILTANNFTGNIPASIGKLRSVQSLYLDDNLFNGTFPAEIANLSSLEVLWLENNPFAPQRIPAEFGNLKKLESLWMGSMNLIGEIPNSFENLTEIQMIDLSQNNLTGSIPDGLWMLKNLQQFILYSNNLTGKISTTVGALALQQIDVSINQLTGLIPADFGNLKQLSVLFMYYNQFSGEIPASIGFLPNLYDLRLFNNKLTGVLPPELGKNCPLWNIEVDDNLLSGELPESLCSQGNLTSIVVSDNNFTGKIPESLGNCSGLNNLQMGRNRFYGELPVGIWSAVNLSTVILNNNSLSGTLPSEIPWNLTRLEVKNNKFSGEISFVTGNLMVFLADDNLLSGSIPPSLTMMSKLQRLSLAGNDLSGLIPDELSSLKSLTDLNLSSNQLTGEIPASLASLFGLTSLDLSNNNLFGAIPAVFGNMKLNFLNLSANELTGEVPFALQNQAYDQSFKSNPGLCSGNSVIGLQSCSYQTGSSRGLASGLKILFIVLGVSIFLLIVIFGVFIFRDYKRRQERPNVEQWKLTSFHSLDFSESNILRGLTEENLIGTGGSGKVYRITIGSRAGKIVAVKKIYNTSKTDSKLEKEFLSEVKILGSVRHTNIVKLLCCITGVKSKLLVYEYMRNGSLERWLHESRGLGSTVSLDWPRRLGIAIGAARGLCYMHHDCSQPIVHRDVKSSNILLDSEFRAKIADFGLARILVKGEEPHTLDVAGSFGYMAPECAYSTKVNDKMDVYSYGVVLLELTTGKKANEGGEHGGLADWAWHHFQAGKRAIDAIDETIRDPSYLDEIANVMKLGLICTGTLPSTRPTMKDVVEILLRCNNAASNGDKPQLEHDVAPLLQPVRGSQHNITPGSDDSMV